jgi:hypothetical protein
VIYLGADLPLADWIAAVERTNARAIVIGALMNADGAAARSVATGVHGVRPDLLVAFGGAAAPEPRSVRDGRRSIRLPDDVWSAVEALRGALNG